MSESKNFEKILTDFYSYSMELARKGRDHEMTDSILPTQYHTGRSLEFHTWNSEELDHNAIEPHELEPDGEYYFAALQDLLELVKGNSIVIPMDSPPRDLLHAYLCVFLRVLRFHTPALFDFPFIIEEIDGEGEQYQAYLEMLKWINTYDGMQQVGGPVIEDPYWDDESAWRLTGFASRIMPRPCFAKSAIFEDEAIIEAPEVNYPGAHSIWESLDYIWKHESGVSLQNHVIDSKGYNVYKKEIQRDINEFVSFLYKMRYIIDDPTLFKDVVDTYEKYLPEIMGTRLSGIYDYVTQTHILKKGLIL